MSFGEGEFLKLKEIPFSILGEAIPWIWATELSQTWKVLFSILGEAILWVWGREVSQTCVSSI